MKLAYIEAGEIVGTHGVRGEMRLNPWCDSPEFIKNFKTLYLDGEGKNPVKVVSSRPHGNIALVKLEGVDTMDRAQAMRGTVLWFRRDDARLPGDRYFIAELIGCRVVDDGDGSVYYGTVTDCAETGANDIWYLEKDGKEYIIPVIDDVVKSVNVAENIIRITPLKGLFGDAD